MLTGVTRIGSGFEVNVDFTETVALETVAEVATAVPAEGIAATPGPADWSYSATAENRPGEIAVAGVDLDEGPGLIYDGPAGGAVRVKVADLDILEGTIAAEATDSYVVGLYLNNDLIAFSDEGVTVIGTGETIVEHNLDTYVGNLQPLDVLHVAVLGLTEETVDYDIALGGNFAIN